MKNVKQWQSWSSTPKVDINRLFEEFGIDRFAQKQLLEDQPVFIRRDIVAGRPDSCPRDIRTSGT